MRSGHGEVCSYGRPGAPADDAVFAAGGRWASDDVPDTDAEMFLVTAFPVVAAVLGDHSYADIELGRIIQQAALFFGIDSAPMHMSVAVGTPALALFGPSGEHMWGPLGDEHQVFALPMPCRPCGQDGCNGSKVSRCLMEIDPEVICRIVDEKLRVLIDR